jgi:hypothetical protein
MKDYFTGLTSYENEIKLNDIENNITETLLSNSDVERNKQPNYNIYILYIFVFFLLTTIFCGLIKYFHLF